MYRFKSRLVHLLLLGLITGFQVGLAANVLVGNFVVQPNQYLNKSGFYLLMQPDCNLVLYNSSLQPVLESNSARTNQSCSLIMQDDGNLVIYNYTGRWDYNWLNQTSAPLYPIWAQNYYVDALRGNRSFLLLAGNGALEYYTTNNTLRPNSTFNAINVTSGVQNYPKFDPSSPEYTAWWPNGSLAEFPYMPAGYFLDAGNKLLAMSGQYSLELGSDCNLQSKQLGLYFRGNKVLWNSSTGSPENRSCTLFLNQDGSLVLYTRLSNQTPCVSSGRVYWNSSKVGASNVSWILKLDPDEGTLSVSDITNSGNILWTNIDVLLPPDTTQPTVSNTQRVWIAVGVVGGSLVLAMAALGLYYYARRSKSPSMQAD